MSAGVLFGLNFLAYAIVFIIIAAACCGYETEKHLIGDREIFLLYYAPKR